MGSRERKATNAGILDRLWENFEVLWTEKYWDYLQSEADSGVDRVKWIKLFRDCLSDELDFEVRGSLLALKEYTLDSTMSVVEDSVRKAAGGVPEFSVLMPKNLSPIRAYRWIEVPAGTSAVELSGTWLDLVRCGKSDPADKLVRPATRHHDSVCCRCLQTIGLSSHA